MSDDDTQRIIGGLVARVAILEKNVEEGFTSVGGKLDVLAKNWDEYKEVKSVAKFGFDTGRWLAGFVSVGGIVFVWTWVKDHFKW